MNNFTNEKISFKWTILEVLKGKTFPVLAAIYVSYFTLNLLFTFWLNGQSGFVEITFLPLIFGVLSILIGILMVWLYQNNKNVSKMMVVGVSTDELERREKKFKWHGLFGILIGYVLWILALAIGNPIAQNLIENGNSIGWLLFFAVTLGVPILIIVTYNPINKKMVEKTGTNVELVEEFKAGLYNQLLPEDCASKTDRNGILVCLEKAEAHTVRGAIYVHRAKRFLSGLGKMGGLVGAIVTVLLFVVTFGVVKGIGKAIGEEFDDALRG